MITAPVHSRDPFGWTCAAALAFALLALVRIGIPSQPYFDEVHYLPAVRALMDFGTAQNLEHPPLGKQIMALGLWLFGDRPFGWRAMSVIFGSLALFAMMRAAWFASDSRMASLLTGLFAGTNFLLFVHARIAMLDIFMLAFVMIALWMCAAACREPEKARLRLILAGAALGAAMAAKWNAVPLAVLPGLAFFAARLTAGRRRLLFSRRGAPVPGISLFEAFLWLGVLPLAVYASSFWPFLFYDHVSGNPSGLIALHRQMLDLQTQVLNPHPYASVWWQWVGNLRAIWYLYEDIDGAQRAVMLIGNPVTMLAGLAALAWCAWAAMVERRRDALAAFVLYLVSLAFWIVAPKPVQFYFHYLLPGCFLSYALALGVERLWRGGERLVPAALVIGAAGCFAYWFPALSAAPLEGPQSFLEWTWFESWR